MISCHVDTIPINKMITAITFTTNLTFLIYEFQNLRVNREPATIEINVINLMIVLRRIMRESIFVILFYIMKHIQDYPHIFCKSITFYI